MASPQRHIQAVPHFGDKGELPMQKRGKRFSVLGLLMGESVVKTHTTDGSPAVIRVPHALLGVIAVIALAMVSGGYWLVSSLTRLDTKMDSVQQNQLRIDRHLETQKAYIDAETSQVKFMQGLMTRDQQRALAEYERNNPKPKLQEFESNRNQ